MKALVLAAGKGTRLRSLTQDLPKPMLPIGGKPIIGHIVCLLREHGVRDIAVNLHHHADSIRAYLGDGRAFGVHITYSHEPELMGTAGAAKCLETFLDETFIVYYGDVLTTANLTKMAELHKARQAWATVAVHTVPDPWAKGVVEVDETGAVVRFVEKPPRGKEPGNLANAGIYVMEPEVLGYVPPDAFYDFGFDVFPVLLEAGAPVYAFPVQKYLLDIGTPDKYAQAESDYERGLLV